jgi:hypothetical protein
MKTILKTCAALAVCAVLLSAANSYAQLTSGPGRQQIDIFATAKPGQWAQFKGEPQKDLTFTATKVKFLTGDLLDNEWEVDGKILAINKQRQEIRVVHRWPIKYHIDTEFEDRAGNAMTIEKLEVGKAIEVEGTFLKDGTFLANQIKEDESKEPEEANRITILGKIEKVNPTTKSIQIMGVTFYITDLTKSKSETK